MWRRFPQAVCRRNADSELIRSRHLRAAAIAPPPILVSHAMVPQSPDRLSVRVGESFTIHLPANPSTGYGWHALYDSASIELVSQRFDRGAPNIGSGGEDVLTFRAVGQGRADVTLELRRPWEKGSRESRRYEVTIEP